MYNPTPRSNADADADTNARMSVWEDATPCTPLSAVTRQKCNTTRMNNTSPPPTQHHIYLLLPTLITNQSPPIRLSLPMKQTPILRHPLHKTHVIILTQMPILLQIRTSVFGHRLQEIFD